MVNDPIGDMLARIRNAAMRKRSKVLTPASRMRERVLEVLQTEGYIRGFSVVQQPGASTRAVINPRRSRTTSPMSAEFDSASANNAASPSPSCSRNIARVAPNPARAGP